MKPFERVIIIGPGLIGASLGLAIKERGLAGEVVGVGRREASVALARQLGAIDRYTLDPVQAVGQADLVVLATGVVTAVKIGLSILPWLKPGCLLTDVASAKTFLIENLSPAVPASAGFVSAHPMAGSEQKGPAAARADLFHGALCILTSTPATRTGDMDRLRQFWQALGSKTCELDAATHDRLIAEISHLPHLAAAALVRLASPEALLYSATGFRDATRLASGDPEVWRDLCLANRIELAAALRRYAAELAAIAAALEAGDNAAIFDTLAQAKEKRDGFFRKGTGPEAIDPKASAFQTPRR